jgi:transglutaminase-like putative cysteine protease
MNRSYLNRSEQVVLFALVFIILQEWLRPIMKLTGTGYFNYFSYFIALCLILSLFDLPKLVSAAIKALYIIWFSEFVYNKLQLPFITFYTEEISTNFSAIINTQWSGVTDSFRTILFFVLIWMLVYLIHHWITVRISIFYFLLLTVFFIATLDTYSAYDGKVAIIKVVVVGLVMTSLLFIKRLVLKRSILIDWQSILKYMIPVVLLVGAATTTAYMLPKSSPKWPDPVPFIKSVGTGESGLFGGRGKGVAQKVGYGTNDEKLGGSFVADDTVVFHVTTKTRQYWRVETKDLYTSKGWRNSGGTAHHDKYSPEESITTSLNVGPSQSMEVAEVDNLSDYDFIIYPYGVTSVDTGFSETELDVNPYTEKFQVYGDGSKVKLENYSIDFSSPIYNYDQLKRSEITEFEEERYLALPSGVPKRVRELAQQITEPLPSAYEKAKAIEKYFARSGFAYSTENVAVPNREDDYVDQFLFETKVGYCDNFSSAMVVLLRAADIPARWVKGFVTGDSIELTEDGRNVYEITNNEAHSWVEAYIEGVGWMPFEPTIGYANPANIDYETVMPEEDDPLEPTEPDEVVIEDPKTQEPDEQDNTPVAPKAKGKEFSLKVLKIPALILLGIIIVGAIIVLLTRNKWLPKYYIRQNNKMPPSRKSYILAYERLLKQLSSYGLKRAKNQTLTSYARKVDRHFETAEMSELTDVYEKLIYSKDVDESKFEQMKESWEYLINKTSG